MLPNGGCAFECVDKAIVVGEAEGEDGGIEGTGEREAGASNGGGGAEVELNSVVELVGVNSVDLGDVEVAVSGEGAKETVEELRGCEAEIGREDSVEEALTEGENAH